MAASRAWEHSLAKKSKKQLEALHIWLDNEKILCTFTNGERYIYKASLEAKLIPPLRNVALGSKLSNGNPAAVYIDDFTV